MSQHLKRQRSAGRVWRVVYRDHYSRMHHRENNKNIDSGQWFNDKKFNCGRPTETREQYVLLAFLHTCVGHVDQLKMIEISRNALRRYSRRKREASSFKFWLCGCRSRPGRFRTVRWSETCWPIPQSVRNSTIPWKHTQRAYRSLLTTDGQRLWKIARFWSVVTPYLIFKKFLPPTNRIRPIRGHSITITKQENGRSIRTAADAKRQKHSLCFFGISEIRFQRQPNVVRTRVEDF